MERVGDGIAPRERDKDFTLGKRKDLQGLGRASDYTDLIRCTSYRRFIFNPFSIERLTIPNTPSPRLKHLSVASVCVMFVKGIDRTSS